MRLISYAACIYHFRRSIPLHVKDSIPEETDLPRQYICLIVPLSLCIKGILIVYQLMKFSLFTGSPTFSSCVSSIAISSIWSYISHISAPILVRKNTRAKLNDRLHRSSSSTSLSKMIVSFILQAEYSFFR